MRINNKVIGYDIKLMYRQSLQIKSRACVESLIKTCFIGGNHCINCPILLDRSPTFLTSDAFWRSSEIVRTKWPIY